MKFFFGPALVFAVAWGLAAHAHESGVREISVPAPARGASIRVTVWYPSIPNEAATAIGSNAVFAGPQAHPNAEVAPGKFPLILVSHGGFRAASVHTGWLALNLMQIDWLIPANPIFVHWTANG